MASWNIPALINKISEDVPAIKALLTALFKWTDAGTEDVPEGAKRLQSVTGGRQIQEYSGSSWGSVGKLMHDVDMLDGKHASTSQTPDTIPVRDANGSIPGNVTGNAATATTASSVSSEYVVPIANGGTGATSAANARTNLGTNNAENITQGVLATARGGTGRNDGKVTDVFLTDYQTGAVGLGQLGQSVLKNAVNCDTLTKQGMYSCTGGTVALKYPNAGNFFVEVFQNGTNIIQRANAFNGKDIYRRKSSDSGASWTGWTPDDASTGGDFHIYISKGGSDSNSGLTADSPVLTLGRAIEIAKGVKTDGFIIFRVGPGEWGYCYFRPVYCQSLGIMISNYTHNNATTIADFDNLTDSSNTGNKPPHFTGLNISGGLLYIGNVHVDSIICFSCQLTTNAIAFTYAELKDCWVNFGAHKVVKMEGVTNGVFYLEHSFMWFGCIASTFVNSPTNWAYMTASTGAELYIHGGASWSGAFAGKKFGFGNSPAMTTGKSPTDYPGALAGEGSYFYYGNLYTNGNIVANNAGPHDTWKYSDIVKGTAPSTDRWNQSQFQDKNGSVLGGVEHGFATDLTNRINLIAYRGTTTDTSVNCQISVGFDGNGNWFTVTPTPAVSDSSGRIANTWWVRNATGGTTLKAATAGTADACAGNSATATRLQTARSIALAGAVTGSANFDGSGNIAINSVWREAFVGQYGSPAVNPWYKVAQVVCNASYSDWEVVLLVENTYGVHAFGILRVHVRTGADNTIETNACTIQWLVRTATINPSEYVLALPEGSGQTAVLWTHVDIDWSGRKFTVLSEGWRGNSAITWTLFNTGLTNGQSASITTSGTQKTSVDVGYANYSETAAASDNSTRIANTAWVRARLGGGEYGMVPSGNPEGRSVGATYTAGTNGFFKVETNDIGDYWAGVWINGHQSQVHIGEYGSGGNWSGNLVFIPVKKGWTYSCYKCSWCGFQPC